MPSEPEDDDIPTNKDGFKTSRARYEFNIDRLAKKYANVQSDVEIDLRTFDMTGTDAEVKKEFKKLAQIGEKFSFGTMSSPVVNVGDLESPQIVAKCLVLNDIFRSTQQGALGLPAPPSRPALLAPSDAERRVVVHSPVTRSRSKAMIEEPSSSANGGDGTPMRPPAGRGTAVVPRRGRSMAMIEEPASSDNVGDGTPAGRGGAERKMGGGGVADTAVVPRGGRSMVAASGGTPRAVAMMIDEDEPAASGVVARAHTVMGTMMMEGEGEGDGKGVVGQDMSMIDANHDDTPRPVVQQPTTTTKRRRGTAARAPAMHDDDEEGAASAYGGGGVQPHHPPTTQTTPPNMMMIEQPISSRTRARARLSLTCASPLAAIAAPPAPSAVPLPIAPTPAAPPKSAGRRLTMPVKKGEDKEEPPKKVGRKPNQKGKKEEEEKKERKRSSDDPPKEIPKKQARVSKPKVAAPVVRKKVEDKNEDKGSDGENSSVKRKRLVMNHPIKHEVIEDKEDNDSSIQVLGQVYRDATTGRELVVEPETKDVKKQRIDNWLEDSFNRTMSDHGSQDEGPCTSTSSASTTVFGDFEKDKDVESFEKIYRRISSSARNRNSNMKMGMIYSIPR